MTHAVGTAGNLGLPSRGPISWEEMGERTPEGRGSSLWTPFSGGVVWGGCTSYRIPGLRPSQRKARSGPPTGWAGWGRGQVPFGKRRRKTILFPTFSSCQQTTSPARPSRWAGHEALVLEAAGQVHIAPTTFPRFSHQRIGFQGEGTSFPLVFFPLFLQRNRANSAVVVGGNSRWKSIQEVYQNGSYLSAQKASAFQGARVPQAYVHRQWAQGSGPSPRQRPCPADPLMPRLTA